MEQASQGERMRKKQVGLLAEYVGYLILVGALFTISNLVGVIALGAVLTFYGIKMRVEGSRSDDG